MYGRSVFCTRLCCCNGLKIREDSKLADCSGDVMRTERFFKWLDRRDFGIRSVGDRYMFCVISILFVQTAGGGRY